MKLFLIIFISLCTGVATAADSLQYVILKLPANPFVFRHREGFRWYAIQTSSDSDKVTLQRNYNPEGNPFLREITVRFPVTTTVVEVTQHLAGRNPSDAQLPGFLRTAKWLIGINRNLTPSTFTNNELACEAAYHPFRNALRVGAAFHLEQNLNHVTIGVFGNVYENADGSWGCDKYQVKYSFHKRNPDDGKYHHEFSSSILESNKRMNYSDLPCLLWYGDLDGDEIPDLIFNKGAESRSYQLVLSKELKTRSLVSDTLKK